MDLTLLPDHELASAAQNGAPGVPGWLALAEMKKRQNIRASAPTQAPQGTVTSNLVAQTLQRSGIGGSPQAPQSASYDQTPQAASGIGGVSQPQSLAGGGVVRYAEGQQVANSGIGASAQPDDMMSAFKNLGLVPQDQAPIQAQTVQYKPAFTPDTGDLDSAVSKMGKIYGPAPDFAGQIAGIDKSVAKANQTSNVGDYLSDLVSGILGGKSSSPVANFGTALGAANQRERDVKAENFKNEMAGQTERNKTQSDMLNRQKDIAQSSEAYHANQQQLANAQATEQVAVDSGNRDSIQRAQEETARLRQNSANIAQRAFESTKDINVAGNLYKQAVAQGNDKDAALWKSVIDQHKANDQSEQDIKTGAELKVEKQRASDARQLEASRQAGERQNAILKANMDNAFLGYHFDKNGNMENIPASADPGTNNDPSVTASGLSPTAKLGDVKGFDGGKTADNMAIEFLKDPTSLQGGKMQGAQAQRMANVAKMRATQLMQANGWTQDDVDNMRDANKAAKTLSTGAAKQLSTQIMAEQKVDAQLDQLSGLFHKLNTAKINFNDQNKVMSFLGMNENQYSALQSGLQTLATEQARAIKGSNQLNEADIKEQQGVLSKGISAGAFDAVAKQFRFDNSRTIQAGLDAQANARYAQHIDQLAKAARGSAPDQDPRVAQRSKLPAGQGATLKDADVAKKFMEAAIAQAGPGASKDEVKSTFRTLLYAKGWE